MSNESPTGYREIYTTESMLLLDLFLALNTSGIKYAVMRNHHSLPYTTSGGDLDIIVAQEDGWRVRAVVISALKNSGGVTIGIADSIGFFKICALGRYFTSSKPSWWGICIDVNVGLFFKGHKLLSESIELPTYTYRDIPVLTDGFAATLAVLKETLNNGIFPVRYAKSARLAALNEWSLTHSLLAPIGRRAISSLHEIQLSDVESEGLQFKCRGLRRLLNMHFYRQHLFFSLKDRATYELTKVLRYFKPPGIVVAVLGVDGVGKTSVIREALPILTAATHNAVVVQHLRPSLLPPLGKLKGKHTIHTEDLLNPHSSSLSGMWGSLLRLTYLTLDYLLGYWFWTRPKIAKQPTVVIFDRYAVDMVIDPRRFRLGISSKTVKLFASLAPKPDLIICLHAEPEVIVVRKQELSLGETRRQVQALRAFANREPRAVLISTDKDIENSRDQFLQAITNFLEARSEI